MSLRPGEEWGQPARGDAATVTGTDADLAAAVEHRPGALVRFVPRGESDLARTLGISGLGISGLGISGIEIAASTSAGRLGARAGGGTELAMDALEVAGRVIVNSLVVGRPPRAARAWHRCRPVTLRIDGREVEVPVFSIVVLNGQHLAGDRLVTRGHPGDGRAEVQWFGVGAADRAKLRTRLGAGEHLGHPAVGQASFRRLVIDVSAGRGLAGRGRAGRRRAGRERPLRVVADGVAWWVPSPVEIAVLPGAYRLLI